MLAPVRWRFFWQMLLVLVGQAVTILLFSWFLRRTYLRYREMDEVLAQQEKLAALGQAASLIAHEVKNSLNGMKAAASMLSADGDRTLPVRTMRGQIDRLSHLATSLLNFGKPANAQLSLTPVGQLVSEAVESLRVLPEAEEVEVTSELDTSLHVRCNPLLLVTALDNLLRNAMEAAVAAKDLGRQAHPRVRITTRRVDGAVRVEVEDNAGGPRRGSRRACSSPSSPRSRGASGSASPWLVRRWNDRAGRWRSSERRRGAASRCSSGWERLPHEQVHPSGRRRSRLLVAGRGRARAGGPPGACSRARSTRRARRWRARPPSWWCWTAACPTATGWTSCPS